MVQATSPPQSWPTMTALASPSARTIPAASDAGDQVVAAGRLVAAAVPAQVRGHRSVTGGRQRLELCPPGPPELREPVQQQDQRPLAGLRDVEPGAVGSDRAVRPRAVGVDRRPAIARHRITRPRLPPAGAFPRCLAAAPGLPGPCPWSCAAR